MLSYDLNFVKLEILNNYIKTYLKTKFFKFLKFFVDIKIVFDKNSKCNFYFYIKYRSLLI